MGLLMTLYVASIVSFYLPHVVDVSASNIFIVLMLLCLLYASLGSRVSPNIVGLMFMGSVVLSICSASRVYD